MLSLPLTSADIILQLADGLIQNNDFQQCGMCDQQRLRPACAYAQTDQSLCLSFEYYVTVKLLTEHHLEFLCLIGGCTGSSESTLINMPHCWKSRVAAQLCPRTLWDMWY